MSPLRIGTRGSQLALWQARQVAGLIAERGGPACEIVVITTSGDRLAEARLADVGGKRLFVKEIEDALLQGTVDLAVHSAKDMPVQFPDGLTIAAVLAREDPRDVLVFPLTKEPGAGGQEPTVRRPDFQVGQSTDPGFRGDADFSHILAALSQSARIGTSSVRRIAQLSRLIPSALFQPIRGNLDTRLRKLDAGEADALVLAAAGLRRLGFAHRISAVVPVTACIPAPGQGIIAVQIRADDYRVRAVVTDVNDSVAGAALTAERAFVGELGGGCQTPVGAVALPIGEELELHGIVTSLDGTRALRASQRGPMAFPDKLGASVAGQLLALGAAEVLEDARQSQARTQGIQP